MINNFFVLTFLSILTVSCAVNKMQPRTVEDYYAQTGTEKYFLPDVPAWASFDQNAGCFRKSGIKYFNIEALMKSYALTYDQAIQIQASFNEEYLRFKKPEAVKAPTMREEELLFYKVSEKISSKILFFDPPTFKRINLIWLDEVAGDEKKIKKLKLFLNSATMDTGLPILVSFCMTRDEVEKQFPEINTKMITAELFSAYDSNGNAHPGLILDLGLIFKPEQAMYFYSQKKFVPEEFKGTIKILNY